MSDGPLAFGGTATTGDFARLASGGGVTTGGIYAFDVASANPALGVQPTGDDFTPGSIILQIINNTGATITALNYAYTAYVRNDQARSNSFDFLIDVDGSGSGIPSTLETLTSVAAAAGTAWVANPFSDIAPGLSIADGSTFYVLWRGDDVGGTVSRDEFAIDDISLTVTLASAGAVPEASAFLIWSLLCGTVLVGAKRRRDLA